MRRIFYAVAGGFFALLLCACIFGEKDLKGEWTGTLIQKGPGDKTYSYGVKMELNGASGLIDYPDLDCGGTLSLLKKTGNVYYYRESITYGKDKCADGGTLAIEPSGNSVKWDWTLSDMPDVTTSGVLWGMRK